MTNDLINETRLLKIAHIFVKESFNLLNSEQFRLEFDEFLPLLTPFINKLKITSGSPESGSYGTELEQLYSISHFAVKKLFEFLRRDDGLQEFFDELSDMNVFPNNSFTLLNPTSSTFGFLLLRYLQTNIKFRDPNVIQEENYLFVYEKNSLHDSLNSIIEILVSDEIEIEFIYAIFGVNFEGEDFNYDINYDKEFILPTNQKREDLSLTMRYFFDGKDHRAFSHIAWITQCKAWIRGKARIKRPPKTINKLNIDNYVKDIDLIPPETIQVALRLLGHKNAEVNFFSISSENSLMIHQVYPTIQGINWSSSLLGHSYPDWMNKRWFTNPEKDCVLVLDDLTKQFLRMYPAFRIGLETNSFESLIFSRYSRMSGLLNHSDTILESVIILESLTTENSTEIGYQLRIKIAWLVTTLVQDRKLIVDIVKQLYVIRSDIVHNGGKNIKKKASELGGLKNAAYFSYEIARLLLLRLFSLKANTLSFLSHKELTNRLEEMMLGEKLTIPTSVIFEKEAPTIIKKIKDINKSKL